MKIVLYRFNYRKTDVVKNLNNSDTFNNAILRYPTNHLNPIIRIDLGELTPNNTSYPLYNYAYIEDFNQRYYFIQNITAISNTIFDLYLHVDVLYTYIGKSNSLLRSNYVFVKRNEYNFNKLVEDDRVNYEYGLKVTYTELVNTGSAAIDLLNLNADSRNVMVTCVIPYQLDGLIDGQGDTTNAYYPTILDNETIPKEATNFNMGSITYILTYGQARELAFKCLVDDQLKSFVKNFVIFPFDLRDASGMNYQTFSTTGQYILASAIPYNFTNNVSQTVYTLKSTLINKVLFTTTNMSQYLKATGNFQDSFLEYNMHSKYEIFIPYVGWVELDKALITSPEQFMIKITGDTDNFEGTVSIYLGGVPYKTMKCKIGCLVSLSTTNAYENAQKENAILSQEIGSTIVGALSMIAGIGLIATGYGAPAGIAGVLGGAGSMIGGTASAISQSMQIYNYAQAGTSTKVDGLFSLQKCILRTTRQNPVTDAYSQSFISENGRPCNKHLLFTTLRGYTELGKCEFSVGSVEEEKELEEITQSGIHFPTTTW